jgi:hypothetical protein
VLTFLTLNSVTFLLLLDSEMATLDDVVSGSMITIPFKVIRDLVLTIGEASEIWYAFLAALKGPQTSDYQEKLRGICKKMDGVFQGAKEKIIDEGDGE